jgi:hypothetical protein
MSRARSAYGLLPGLSVVSEHLGAEPMSTDPSPNPTHTEKVIRRDMADALAAII